MIEESDPYLKRLFAGIHGDESERELVGILHLRVTVIWKDGARIRRSPAIANNRVRVAEYNETFETGEVESVDIYNNRWIKIPEGYICTFYYGTPRATVEIIPS